MLLAIDDHGNRIRPERGKYGLCQLCRQRVKAYCGEININHWRHVDLNQCDCWNDGETEWHRRWKNEFPETWQEVLIDSGTERHIADIRTPRNLILELQNSSISSSTIRIRENFYANMVWLINADDFKENFSITSRVKYELRKLEDYYSDSGEPEESTEIKEVYEEKKQILNKIQNNEYTHANIKTRITELNELESNIEKTAQDYVDGTYYHWGKLKDFKTSDKVLLKNLKDEKQFLEEQLKKEETNRQFIEDLRICELKGYEQYKYIEPTKVNSSSFTKCLLLEKDSAASLFPTILTFKSKLEFEQISRNPKYDLLVNPTEKANENHLKINHLKSSLEKTTDECFRTFQRIVSELKLFLTNSKEELEEKFNEVKVTSFNLSMELINLEVTIAFIQEKEKEEMSNQNSENENYLKKERFKIMKSYKGHYFYNWKYKRRSWNFAEKPIFLDFGNKIFGVIDDHNIKRYSRNEFIEKIKTEHTLKIAK